MFEAFNVLDSKQKVKLKASIANGYVHLISTGTRMGGTPNVAVKGKKLQAFPTSSR